MIKTTLILLLAVTSAFALNWNSPVHDPQLVHDINHDHSVHWLATLSPRFANQTWSDVRGLLGALEDNDISALPTYEKEDPNAPDSFDSRTKWPTCIHPIMDQARCGSCWAFGAAESLSDRFCIATGGKTNVVLSPQDLVSCDWEGNQGCNGGIPRIAWDWMEVIGLRTIDCIPYSSGGGDTGVCQHKCDGTSTDDHKYKVKPFSVHSHYTVNSMKEDIMNNGPIEGTFTVYQDFMSYSSGIYEHKTGEMLGGHAIKIIGWGEQAGVEYWIVANSWGPSWGMDGFFWIKKGDCGIDSGSVAGLPHT